MVAPAVQVIQDTLLQAGPRDASGWTATRRRVVALCFVLNMLDGADLLVMSFIAPVLSELWHISPERLGLLFSMSLAGMAVGCLLIAPLADRFGRRALILGSLLLVAVAMVASGLSRTLPALMAARLLVGLGVGTIGVSMTATAAEFAPDHHADFAVGFVQAGWPLGSLITAFAAARELPLHGWRPLLIGIGLLSTGLLVLIWRLLPESLPGVSPGGSLPRVAALPAASGGKRGPHIAALFHGGRARASMLLWSAVTLTYFVLYFVISWVPKLAAQAGLPLSQAIYAGASYNVGAFLGTASVGWIAIWFPLPRVIAAFLVLAAVAMLIFGGFGMPVWLTLLVALCVGITVQGGFNGFWALAARLYPADLRSTGIGWALGVGRVGAVLGPIVGGELVGAHVPIATIFAIYTVPLLAAAGMTLGIHQNLWTPTAPI